MTNLETILIVEDDTGVGNIVRKMIMNEGLQAFLALNTKEGIDCLNQHPIDVLITDLQLPDEDGLSLIRQAVQIQPDITSVIMTGCGSLDSAIAGIRLGVCDYVTKPFNQQQIISSLHHAIQVNRTSKLIKRKSIPQEIQSAPATSPADDSFIGVSASMQKVLSTIKRIARLDFPVLLQGEISVGKKTLAKKIHRFSQVANEPFTHFNCSSISNIEQVYPPENFVLKMLKRSHSNMNYNKGTIFLEDIDQLPMYEQKQLLSMREHGLLKLPARINSEPTSLRLIASTTTDLSEAVSRGTFHRSLYDWLNLLPINVPPLRERRADIKPLSIHILEQLTRSGDDNHQSSRHIIDHDTWETLTRYDWPGNVQELTTVLSKIVILGDNSFVDAQLKNSNPAKSMGSRNSISVPLNGDLKSMEQYMVTEVVKRCGGNKAEAARTLGMHRRTLYRILENKPLKNESPRFEEPIPH
ncbi:sigma-54-dependent transcriptional regulator [Gimesia sp.]|uniref:sigma-54-dependent transcriptional regulator n=1 Tax=Gimesia sp. TaxID=2024833 RepID=UPI003A926DD8